MGHLASRNYLSLINRMNKFFPEVPYSDCLYEILKILFSEEDAMLCSVMPLGVFPLKKIAKIWGKTHKEANSILDRLCKNGVVYNFNVAGTEKYALTMPVLGFFEFSLMRLDGKFDKKKLSELYHQYINIEEDFRKNFASIDPPLTRIFVHEDTIEDLTSEILSYEKASNVIDTSSCITVGTCFCRHKMEHIGKACENPQEVCLTFNLAAQYLSKHGIVRRISKEEAHKVLDLCVKKGLVQIGDNKKQKVAFICNCCGCCCDLLLGYKRMGFNNAIIPSNYNAQIDDNICTKCGICIIKCPVDAISLTRNVMVVDKQICLGCGVCSRFCPTASCKMQLRPARPFVPNTIFEKIYLQAVNRGKLGNLIFPGQTSFIHRVLSRALNLFIKIPFIKKILLNKRLLQKIKRQTNLFKKVEIDVIEIG